MYNKFDFDRLFLAEFAYIPLSRLTILFINFLTYQVLYTVTNTFSPYYMPNPFFFVWRLSWNQRETKTIIY